MKEFKQLGAYGLVIQDGKILLIKNFETCYSKKFCPEFSLIPKFQNKINYIPS